MKTKLFELERIRDSLKILRDDAKRTREQCKQLTKSNTQLQKDLHKSTETNEKLKDEDAKLKKEEKRRMSLLPQTFDQICLSSHSVAWKSAADSSSISPFGTMSDSSMTFEPEIINAQPGKGAIPRRYKNTEGNQEERKHEEYELESTDDSEFKSDDEFFNLDDADYLYFKVGDNIPARRHGCDLYSSKEYAISSGIDLKEQSSKKDPVYEERYDREKDWKLQGRLTNTKLTAVLQYHVSHEQELSIL